MDVKVTAGTISSSITGALLRDLAAILLQAPLTITAMATMTTEGDGIIFKNSTGSEIAVMTEVGNVGIGTTEPLAALSFGVSEPQISLDTQDGSDNKALVITSGG